MPRTATIESLPEAFRTMKAMRAEGVEWDEDYRRAGADALKRILEGRMADLVAEHLDDMGRRGLADRRNGSWPRRLMTELGEIELAIPRTRTFSPLGAIRAYARRAPRIDRLILACFVLGLSTRKVAAALVPILGRRVSPSSVSRVAKALDGHVAAFHRRKLADAWRVLVLDGVFLARKTGAGAVRRPVLVALGLRPDGKKEIVDYRLARGESFEEWEAFLCDLQRRGLSGERLEMVCSDGGKGLARALDMVWPRVPVQRCWAHKIRNVLDKLRKADRPAAKDGLRRIMRADTLPQARAAARRFADDWRDACPAAVACLRDDLDDLLACFRYKTPAERRAVRTTNAIERRFREVRRRTRPMGVLNDRASTERILFAVFAHENQNQGVPTLLPLTQNS